MDPFLLKFSSKFQAVNSAAGKAENKTTVISHWWQFSSQRYERWEIRISIMLARKNVIIAKGSYLQLVMTDYQKVKYLRVKFWHLGMAILVLIKATF